MQLNGRWLLCDDGIPRPTIPAEIQARDGSWQKAEFLVDSGADRTVFSAQFVAALGLSPMATAEQLGGVGGTAKSVIVETQVRFTHDAAGKVVFRGQYAAVTELEALDMCVLGRDITNLFAVIVDHPQNVVCLISQRHQYRIETR